MDTNISIKQASITDTNEIIRLLTELWSKWELDKSIVKALIEKGIESGNKIYLLAMNNQDYVGLGTLSIIDDLHYRKIAILDELVITESFRGQKLGTNLLNAVVERAKLEGCSKIQLHCSIHRPDSHAFYKKNGFESLALFFRKDLA